MKKVISIYLFIILLFSLSACDNKNSNCEKGNHNTEWVTTIEPTCTSYGSKYLRCKDCKVIITTSKIEYLNHTIVLDEQKDATCEEEGHTEGSHCSVCNTIIEATTIIKPKGHNYVLDTEASNEELLVYKCLNCSKTYNEVNNGSICTNHTESEWQIINDSTCNTLGEKQKTCLKCGVVIAKQSIEMKNHTLETVLGYEATCEKDGLSNGEKCKDCGLIVKKQEVIEAVGHNYVVTDSLAPTTNTAGYVEYTCSNCNHSYKEEIADLGSYNPANPTVITFNNNKIVVSNDNGGVNINGTTITITLSGEYDLKGTLSEGNIIIRLNEEDQAKINLVNVNITSSTTDPIYIESGDKVEISSKRDTINYIYDKRTIETDAIGGAIYSKVDLEIQGNGELNIESTYNNGIASTKDLEIKNLILNVNAPNNALKGNDSITIESGTIKAISSSGDALKTENSDISDKGNQRGIITIESGKLDLYAACDGIDAAYDVVINGGTINIFTESYSNYSGDVTVTSSSTIYIRVSSRSGIQNSSYKYSAKFTNEKGEITWSNATVQSGQSRYYEVKKPSDAIYVQFYCYNSSQTQGQDENYIYYSDQMAVPASMDEYYITSVNSSNKKFNASWNNHSTQQSGSGGRPGMGGGMNEGNPNSSTYSCKGIKADNSITINNGNINIKSHDDGIHTNSDVLLDTGVYGKATLTINSGNITIHTDDDGIHADGILTVNGGNIIISNSYEGVEGNIINLAGGTIQMKSSDDGTNAKSALNFTGATVYLDAGGDGIDSNGTITMTNGIVLAQGPSNGGNGVLDFDRSFSFSGGLLLAVGCNGMNQKPTAQSGSTSTSKTVQTSTSSYLTVTSNNTVVAVIKITKNSQNYCVLAYNNTTYPNCTVNVTTSNSNTLVNGLYYVK